MNDKRHQEMAKDRPFVIPLTSHSEKAGKLLKKDLLNFLQSHDSGNLSIADVAASYSDQGRSAHQYRSYIVANNQETALKELANTDTTWTRTDETKPRLGFVFTGQGAQWFAMGRQLVEQSPFFRQTLERCDAVFQKLAERPDWSIVEELLKTKETSRLNETIFSQPICTALQVALVDLLGQWGIEPSAVVGHSAGEMGAAYAAGILSFDDALICGYYRGLALSMDVENQVKFPGAMMAVGMTEAEGIAQLKPYEGRIVIACVNSPSSLTLSGDEPAIIELKEELSAKKIFNRQLQVSTAYHSHHIAPFGPTLLKFLKGVKPQPAKCRMFSSVTARAAQPTKMGAEYWVGNLTGQVRFSDALTGILLDDEEELNVDALIEIGPHSALRGPSRQILQGLKINIPYLASLTRGVPDFEGLLALAGQLFAMGYPADLNTANSNLFIDYNGSVSKALAGHKVKLPSYSWDHAKYWSETRVIKNHRLRKHTHALLGSLVPAGVDNHPIWRNYLRPSEIPWLSQHMIEGKVIFPAAGYISMAIEAVTRLDKAPTEIKYIALRDVAIKSALTVSAKDVGTEILLELHPLPTSTKRLSDNWYRFTVSSFDENEKCIEHCSGTVAVEMGEPAPLQTIEATPTLAQLQKSSDRSTPLVKYYEHLHALGLQYGEEFRLLSGKVESGPGFAMAPLTFQGDRTATVASELSLVHPALLDASFHVLFAAIESLLGRSIDEPFVPTFLRSMKISGEFQNSVAPAEEQRYWAYAKTKLPGPRVAINDIAIRSEDCSKLLIHMQGLEVTALGGDSSADGPQRSLFFQTRWQPAFDCLGSNKQQPSFDGLAHAMDLFAHQYPNCKILHITPRIESVQEALRHLGGRNGERRRFQKLTPYSYSTNSAEKWDSLHNEWSGLIEINEPKAAEYDVVVLGEPVETIDIKALLKPNGFVIADSVYFDGQGLSPVFESTYINAWRSNTKEPASDESLTIVMSPHASKRTQKTASLIEASYGGNCVSKVSLTDLSNNSPSEDIVLGPSEDNLVILTSLDEHLFFEDCKEEAGQYRAIQKLLTSAGKNVVWVLEGATMKSERPEQALVFGLARVARSENEDLRLVILDMQPDSDSLDISNRVLQTLDRRLTEDEITEQNGTLFIPRVEANDILNAKLPVNSHGEPKLQPLGKSRPLALKIGKVGLLETLVFGDDEEIIDAELADDEIELEVKASAINFRDVAASMGIIDDYRLGDECAGIVLRIGSKVDKSAFQIGDRVVAWRPGQGAHRTICRNPAILCYKLDDNISFADAAAFPCILTTAYFSLIDTARLRPGETILIHSAAGGVGQMAVQVAQMIGAHVIVTVGSQGKRDLMKSKFGLTDDQIFNSRDTSFVQDILRFTNGRGVDVALNSLAGELLHATWSVIAAFGRFIEIGKRDIHENAKIDMDPFRKNVLFASVDLITIFERNKLLGARLFQDCCKLVEDGTIKSPYTVAELSYAEAQKGFRLLQMGRHTGKVVLVPNKDDLVPVLPPVYRNTALFNPAKTYLLVGGLGGLGRTLAEWMVRKGARKLAFLSRSGATQAEAKSTVDWLEARDIAVSVFRADVTNAAAVKECIDTLSSDLAGVFQAAMVLQDAPLDKMTHQQWQKCVHPKVRGTYNLHQATLLLDLDFFICFSSGSCILGSKGQSNYSAANCYLDALMRHRREIGLKGATMDCGMIVGVGAVAENAALEKVMMRMGYDPVVESELLYQIEEAVLSESTQADWGVGVEDHQIITGINLARDDLYWAAKPLLRNLYSNHDFSGSTANTDAGKSLIVRLRSEPDPAERILLLTTAFIEKIAAVLGVAQDTILASNPLSAYGLDSIVAVEFRKWFSKTIQVDIALFDVLGSKSITALVSKAAGMIVMDAGESKEDSLEKKEKVETSGTSGAQETAVQSTSAEFILKQRPSQIPMSTFQQRMWFAHNLVDDKASLNVPVICYMKGTPDIPTLKAALDETKRRNAILRTSYFEGDDFAEQEVTDDIDSHLTVEDFSALENPEESLNDFVATFRKSEMEIEEGEVLKVALIKLGEAQWVLASITHHIAIDRGSSKPYLTQFVAFYDAIRAKQDLALVAVPKISYADFTFWHETRLQSAAIQPHIQFWKEKFNGAPAVNKLMPFAKSDRPQNMDTARAIHKTTLGLSMLKRMKRICAHTGTTPFHFLLAAFRSFLYRYTEEDDLTIHMIDGNRPHPELDDVIGFFVNIIPIRFTSNADTRFDNLLEDAKARSLEGIEHREVPFDTIVDIVKAEKSASHFPLGQVVINYQIHGKMPKFPTADFEINRVDSDDIPTACEMALEALEDPERGLDLRLEYSTTIYGEADMERFLDNFLTFMTSAIKDHRQPITEMDICGPKELKHLDEKYWATGFTENTWQNASVMEKFYQQAKASPHATAIKTSGGQQISYADLGDDAKSIGASLRGAGALPGQYIGILSRPGIDTISAMMGVLLSRCGYLAMDPEFAVDRLAFMASDSAINILLVGEGLESLALTLASKVTDAPQVIPISHAATWNCQ